MDNEFLVLIQNARQSRRVALVKALRKELEDAKMRHVELLVCTYNKRFCVKFLDLDTDRYREKLKAITDKYGENLELVKETKTTRTFAI